MKRDEILKLSDKENVRFMRLQFTDILGVNKNVLPSPMKKLRVVTGAYVLSHSSSRVRGETGAAVEGTLMQAAGEVNSGSRHRLR